MVSCANSPPTTSLNVISVPPVSLDEDFCVLDLFPWTIGFQLDLSPPISVCLAYLVDVGLGNYCKWIFCQWRKTTNSASLSVLGLFESILRRGTLHQQKGTWTQVDPGLTQVNPGLPQLSPGQPQLNLGLIPRLISSQPIL